MEAKFRMIEKPIIQRALINNRTVYDDEKPFQLCKIMDTIFFSLSKDTFKNKRLLHQLGEPAIQKATVFLLRNLSILFEKRLLDYEKDTEQILEYIELKGYLYYFIALVEAFLQMENYHQELAYAHKILLGFLCSNRMSLINELLSERHIRVLAKAADENRRHSCTPEFNRAIIKKINENRVFDIKCSDLIWIIEKCFIIQRICEALYTDSGVLADTAKNVLAEIFQNEKMIVTEHLIRDPQMLPFIIKEMEKINSAERINAVIKELIAIYLDWPFLTSKLSKSLYKLMLRKEIAPFLQKATTTDTCLDNTMEFVKLLALYQPSIIRKIVVNELKKTNGTETKSKSLLNCVFSYVNNGIPHNLIDMMEFIEPLCSLIRKTSLKGEKQKPRQIFLKHFYENCFSTLEGVNMNAKEEKTLNIFTFLLALFTRSFQVNYEVTLKRIIEKRFIEDVVLPAVSLEERLLNISVMKFIKSVILGADGKMKAYMASLNPLVANMMRLYANDCETKGIIWSLGLCMIQNARKTPNNLLSRLILNEFKPKH